MVDQFQSAMFLLVQLSGLLFAILLSAYSATANYILLRYVVKGILPVDRRRLLRGAFLASLSLLLLVIFAPVAMVTTIHTYIIGGQAYRSPESYQFVIVDWIAYVLLVLISVGAAYTIFSSVARSKLRTPEANPTDTPNFEASLRLAALRVHTVDTGLVSYMTFFVLPTVFLVSVTTDPNSSTVGLSLALIVVTAVLVSIKLAVAYLHPEYTVAVKVMDLHAKDKKESITVSSLAPYNASAFRGAKSSTAFIISRNLERYVRKSARRLEISERDFVTSGVKYFNAQVRAAARVNDEESLIRIGYLAFRLITTPDQVCTARAVLALCPELTPAVRKPDYEDVVPEETAIRNVGLFERVAIRLNLIVPLASEASKLVAIVGLIATVAYALFSNLPLSFLVNLLRDLR